MCINCVKTKLDQLKAVFPVPENGWHICIMDHGDHTHIRINGQEGGGASEWVQVPVDLDTLRSALPANTRVHLHARQQDGDRGCSQQLVSAIPTIKWSMAAAPQVGLGDDPEMCAVCYDDFRDGQEVTVLPCSHRYHAACVAPWLLQNNSCPACRFKITTESLQSPPKAAAMPAASVVTASPTPPVRADAGGAAAAAVASAPPASAIAEAATTMGSASWQWALVVNDSSLPAGSRVKVAGREGLYEGFTKRVIGANDHLIRFDDAPTRPECVRLRSKQWYRSVATSQ
eukprot:COSAG05_NODE_267_length_12595_cov_7.076905_14_plen_287_part_00